MYNCVIMLPFYSKKYYNILKLYVVDHNQRRQQRLPNFELKIYFKTVKWKIDSRFKI